MLLYNIMFIPTLLFVNLAVTSFSKKYDQIVLHSLLVTVKMLFVLKFIVFLYVKQVNEQIL